MPLDFGNGPVDAPPPPPDTEPNGPLICEVCGTPLQYAGRGRKPRFCDDHKPSAKSSTGSTRRTGTVSDRDLNLACDNLRQLYDALSMPLQLLSPNAAALWGMNVETLDARNHQTLANNKGLVKRINSVGERGGSLAFVLAHVFAVAPVVMVLSAEAKGAAAQARAQRAAEDAQYDPYTPDGGLPPDVGTPYDPDAAFRANRAG